MIASFFSNLKAAGTDYLLISGHPQCVEATEGEWGDLLRKYQDTPAADKDEAGEILADQMQARMLRHQKADRQYWRVRIDELEQLRAQGRSRKVTYDFARRSDNVTEIKCSAFGQNIVDHMG